MPHFGVVIGAASSNVMIKKIYIKSLVKNHMKVMKVRFLMLISEVRGCSCLSSLLPQSFPPCDEKTICFSTSPRGGTTRVPYPEEEMKPRSNVFMNLIEKCHFRGPRNLPKPEMVENG